MNVPANPQATVDLSVVIINWNSKDYLKTCLQSLARHSPAGLTLEVIVVDGGSFDGVDRMLATEFPAVRFVQSPDNVGFARANNLGARHATGRSLLLLNPDTELIEDVIGPMQAALLSTPHVGAVGCRLLNTDHSLQHSCVQSFPTLLNQALDAEFLREAFPRSRLWGMTPLHASGLTDAEVLSGACILLRRQAFTAVGGFTESYFMYGEDLDLCFKLWREGWRVCHLPTVRLVHFGGGSSRQAASNFSTVRMRDSVHHFLRLHRGAFAAFGYRATTTLAALVRLAVIAPLSLLGDRVVRHGAGSLRKWAAVLRWSVGLAAPAPAHRAHAAATSAPTPSKTS